jgi:hypothetical protein
MRHFLLTLAANILVAASAGCQGEYRSDAKKLTHTWTAGDYPAAASLAYKDAREEARHKKNRVVYFLEGGRAAQAAGDYETSVECFDAAFVDTFPYMKESPEATVSEAIVTTATNATMSRYRGTPNDRILLHAINALNFMAMGRMADARVELNRAILWTDDAQHRYGKAIDLATRKNNRRVSDASAEWDSKRGDAWSGNTSGVMNNNTRRIISEHYGELPARAAYADYVNPWAMHLDAVFRLSGNEQSYDNDFIQARSSLDGVVKMSPGLQSHLQAELGWARDRTSPPPTTWVYFMNGMGPHLTEEKIFMPIPISGGFNMPTLALPKMVFSTDHIESLSIETNSGPPTQSRLLVNTADIAGWQFKERLPMIISHEAIRATGKAVATYMAMQMAQQSQNAWASVFAMGALLYQVGSAQADLRCWRTMPAEIQVARLATPPDGVLRFKTPDGRHVGTATVAANQSNILVVSLPSTTATMASIMPIQLTGPRNAWTPTFSLKPPPEVEDPTSDVDGDAEVNSFDETPSETASATTS